MTSDSPNSSECAPLLEGIKQHVREWNLLRDEARRTNDLEDKKKAESYYYVNILPLIAEIARIRWVQTTSTPTEVLISVLGYSPATSIIATTAVQPRHLILITSSAADTGIDMISAAVSPTIVAPRNLHHRRCDPTNPLDIYEKIRRALEGIQASHPGQSIRAMIDITGGKKVMSAAASLVAWRLNLPLCYIESEFDPVIRMPRPGTEHLIFLDNPINLYREEEIETALKIFDAGHYAQAKFQFRYLADHLSDATQCRFMAELSQLYGAWCDLDLPEITNSSVAVTQMLPEARQRQVLSAEQDQRLNEQLKFLANLVHEEPATRLLSLYLLGRHYGHTLKRWDFAALFFYRTIEGCLTERLSTIDPCFGNVPVQYDDLGVDLDDLLEKFNLICDTLGEGQRERSLPPYLGLMNSAALLLAFEDTLLDQAGYAKKGLNDLKHLSSIRNGSVLAHGYQVITGEHCEQLEKASTCLLQNLFQLQGWTFPGKGLKDTYRILEFIRFSHA